MSQLTCHWTSCNLMAMAKPMERSPLALPFPDLGMIAGVRIGTASVAYKQWTRDCVTLIELAPGTAVAGVTTKSRCPSPEVELCRAKLPGGRARGLIVNAGNSNAFTGLTGRQAAAAQAARVAERLGCDAGEVFSASTGVIGVPLPIDKARAGIAAALAAKPSRTTGSALSHIHGLTPPMLAPMRWWNSVCTKPGHTAVTLTPCRPYRRLAERLKLVNHALAAP